MPYMQDAECQQNWDPCTATNGTESMKQLCVEPYVGLEMCADQLEPGRHVVAMAE